MNKISYLQTRTFFHLSLEEKLKVKEMGRPTPDMDINKEQQSKNVHRIRKFNRDIYNKNKWICGCELKNALFCFPCVLFGGDKSWTKNGVVDLVHLGEKIRVHEKSHNHINNVMSLALVGSASIRAKLDSQNHQEILKHNQQVERNRYVLNLIIHSIRSSEKLELALREYNMSQDYNNKRDAQELIRFSAELDKELKGHLSSATGINETAKTIQDDLLECMLKVYHEEVTQEINKADYVAIIAEEICDTSLQSLLVLILRYIIDGSPVERFWTFLVPEDHDAQTLAQSILKELQTIVLGQNNKLIAQSYDGVPVMSGSVQELVREEYKYAKFIHCYAHQINQVMTKVSSINRQARIFFSEIAQICAFFSTSPERTQILDEIARERLPRSSQKGWNFHSRGVKMVYENRRLLVATMDKISESETVKSEAISQACSFRYFLNEPTFLFWLGVFYQIIPHVEVIFAQMQYRKLDPVNLKNKMEYFEKCIQGIKGKIDDIIRQVKIEVENEPLAKRRKDSCDLKKEALEVCDAILQELKARFDFSGHIIASRVFDVEQFDVYQKRFPEIYLKELLKAYPFFEENKLRGELFVIFSRPELRSFTATVPLLSFLQTEDLCDHFQQTLALLKLLITLPMPSSEPERCFSTLKHLKTFLRNTVHEETLNALAMLSCEKAFVDKIPNFNKKVMDLFTGKEERRLEFKYRTC